MAHRGTQALPLSQFGELMRTQLPQTSFSAFAGGFLALLMYAGPGISIAKAIMVAAVAAVTVVLCVVFSELRGGNTKHADIDELVKRQRKQPGVIPMYDESGRRIETEAERARSRFP